MSALFFRWALPSFECLWFHTFQISDSCVVLGQVFCTSESCFPGLLFYLYALVSFGLKKSSIDWDTACLFETHKFHLLFRHLMNLFFFYRDIFAIDNKWRVIWVCFSYTLYDQKNPVCLSSLSVKNGHSTELAHLSCVRASLFDWCTDFWDL